MCPVVPCLEISRGLLIFIEKSMGGWKDGMHFVFAGKQARCNICTKMVFPTEIKNYNERMLNQAASRENIMH